MPEEYDDINDVLVRLPGKDCGLCGYRTCRVFAQVVMLDPGALEKCPYVVNEEEAAPPTAEATTEEVIWTDALGREYDFILHQYPDDPGPRETILPFNPANVEKLGVKKGDVLFGRPAMAGCPVTHVGLVVEEPDYFNGVVVWCVVGPMEARKRGINIGSYNPIAYEGIVSHSRVELQVGRRYFFLPRTCMLQSRHSGVVNTVMKTKDGILVRVEGIQIA